MDNAKADDVFEVGTNLGREVVVLEDNRDCLRAVSSTFEDEVAIDREADSNIAWVGKEVVGSINAVDNDSPVEQAPIVCAIEDVSDPFGVMLKLMPIAHFLDESRLLEKRLKSGD